MKILVCISNVPDTTTKVKFVDDNKKLDTAEDTKYSPFSSTPYNISQGQDNYIISQN